ncbi:hypothetical protein ACSVDE_04545 [Pseudalkalibacillus sp. Hm43]|uniref:hypothetical protein n=1 Tax=Pseudalkalibacillus sp. Hm43 TaxID=3450742 RepID=UPI003F41F83C
MGRGFFGNEDWKKKKEDRCEGCICDVFRTLDKGARVKIAFLSEEFFTNGGEINFTFLCFDDKTCCVTLRDDNEAVLVDCRDIIAIELLD